MPVDQTWNVPVSEYIVITGAVYGSVAALGTSILFHAIHR